MLSAVAVGSEDYPGEGFFTLANALGLLNTSEETKRQSFWEQQRDRVYADWYVD